MPEIGADLADRELRSKERVWRNRTSIMESGTKDFTAILSTLQALKVRLNFEILCVVFFHLLYIYIYICLLVVIHNIILA